jgi:2-keto-4-pentenoate hydratase/2-oxohepta-3-ene-1,7-dioic acid hydratase in catechol pathway
MDKVICVGKNYLKHAQELGDAVPENAIIFFKPPSTVCQITASTERSKIIWPRGEVHHEVELVFRLSERSGTWAFSEYTIGLDMTLRDIQSQLKKDGQPWERAKVFKNAAVVGPWRPVGDLAALLNAEFSLDINGKQVQVGFGRDMRFSPENVLRDLTKWLPLKEGDLLFTGTPEGVGPVQRGDVLSVKGPRVSYQLEVLRE